MEPLSYEKRGYLNEIFRLFHLKDCGTVLPDYHYHSFHKIVFLLGGEAGYSIEGERYDLQPGDFVLVGQGSIHRPEVVPETEYERMILYVSPDYLLSHRSEDCDLETCFHRSQEDYHFVFHTNPGDELQRTLFRLDEACRSSLFGAELMKETVFLQLMVAINRAAMEQHYINAISGDAKIVAILRYISAHLDQPLSVEELSDRFYISKYHMMRRFKEETGYTVHAYLTEKRMLRARQLIQSGTPALQAAAMCGYPDYSAFSRAFKKQMGYSPAAGARQYRNEIR